MSHQQLGTMQDPMRQVERRFCGWGSADTDLDSLSERYKLT